MEFKVDNYIQLCRICFKEGNHALDSFMELVDEKITIQNMLEKLSALDLALEACCNIPSLLCTNCLNEMVTCYMFLKKLKKANKRLQQLSGIETLVSSDQEESNNESSTEIYANIEFLENESNSSSLFNSNENNLTRSVNENSKILSEKYEQDKTNCIVSAKSKAIKRKVRSGETPNNMVTHSICSILSKMQECSKDSTKNDINDSLFPTSLQQKIKIKPTSKIEEKESLFVVTKFVLSADEIAPSISSSDNKEKNNLEEDCKLNVSPPLTTVSHIRTFDMAPVEVKATSEIIFQDSDEDTNTENPNTMYKCKYCPRAYSTSFYLIKHARKCHCCQFCMKGFEKTEDLYKHIRKEHNKFDCTLCDKIFSINSNLRHHMRRVHNIHIPAHTSILAFQRK